MSSFDIITSRLKEVLNQKYLSELLNSDKLVNAYWGTAPTGKIHIGYLCPLLKIADLIDCGCNVTILLADVHAFLDSRKSPIDEDYRSKYYEIMIKEILKILKVDLSKVVFIRGSSFQYSVDYMKDQLVIANDVSIMEAKNAGSQVVKQSNNPKLTSLLYPIMQSLDEKYLNADIELGGIDQRKIFAFSIDHVHKYTRKNMVYLMNPIIPPLSTVSQTPPSEINDAENKNKNIIWHKLYRIVNFITSHIGEASIYAKSFIALDTTATTTMKTEEIVKMSASCENGKIDILDTPKTIRSKINKVYCLPGDVSDNTLLPLCEHVIFPLLSRLGSILLIERPDKYGGNLAVNSYDDLKYMFNEQKLHPGDLKSGISSLLSKTFAPVRDVFSTKDMVKLLENAYPKENI